MSNLYSTAGLISKELGKYDESMDYYNKAEKVALSKYNSFDMFMGRLYTNKGLLYKLKGDYNKSKQYLFYATKVYEQNVITYNPNLGTAYNLIGRIYQATCQYIKAMEYFLKGIDNVKSIKYKNSQYQDLSSLYFNCAECEDSLKNYDLSEKYYNLAISYSINDNRKDTVLLGKEYFSYGIFCMRIKEFSKGNKLFFKGYNILLKKLGGKHLFISEALKQLADYYMYRNDLQTALKYYQKSIIAITGDFEDTDIYRNPGLKNVLSDVTLSAILKNKAECFSGLFGKTRRLSDLEMSLNTYELTISLIEKLRSQYLTEESKLFLTQNETSTFAKAIRVATDLFLKTGKCEYRDKAFALAEKNKSANLLSSIRQVEANTFGGIPDSLQVKEKQFKEEIAYLNNLIYNEKLGKNNKSKINEWEKKIFELNNRYDTLVSFFEKQYSSFYALKYNDEIINISGLQSKLNSKQTLVEYVLTDSVLYVFICDSSNFREITVRIDSAFFINLDYVIKAISVNDFENYTVSRFVEYVNSAYYVYSKLLLPVEEYIKTGELVIVPDGNISYLPFEALVYNNVIEGRKSFRAIKYLIYKYTFSYSYSATLLFNKTGRNYSTNTLIAFAPEYDNLDKLDSAHLQAIKNFRNSLQNLPYVDNEISKIRHIVGGRSFKGNEATEDNFKADASASGIIHLAMHSVIDPENPMYSKLVFTQTNDGKEDGLLNAFEIYNLQLEAKLAVLSACNTGYGKLEKGEGVMSFARGFLYAGCKSILMTLWTVEDKSGYLLTSAFYRELNEGKNVNEALRSAKLEFLKNADQLRSHPYFWAAYVNIGSTDKVFTERRSNYNYVPLIFISVAVIIFILIISRKSIKRRFISHVNITDDNFELF
jgi:CHAT domain-containing protein